MNELLTQEQRDTIEAILKGVVPEGKVGVLVYTSEEGIPPEVLVASLRRGLESASAASVSGGATTFDLTGEDPEESHAAH